MTIALELVRNFDPAVWQTCQPPQGGSVLLLTWTVTPEPVDGGIPEAVQNVLAKALVSNGVVAYAGDAQVSDKGIAVDISRGLRRRTLSLYRATLPEKVLLAFTSGKHDWSQNSQWLIVTSPSMSAADVASTAGSVYANWRLPEPWPSEVRVIVQSAVDGDGAACFTIDREVEERFVASLKDAAESAAISVAAPSP